MISIHLMGGLGNQLFQIATIVAYSIKNSMNFILPYSKKLTTGLERPTYWDTLLKENTMFCGYFQSYKYFDSYKKEVLEIMGISRMQYDNREEFADLFEGSHAISMHFRIGDYKEKQQYHPVLPYEYYENTIEYLISELQIDISIANILYFCEEEDIDEVEQIIQKLKAKYGISKMVRIDYNIPDWKQMLIMSNCQINIIANSTFSWWAAYLNNDSQKVVIYPNTWFGTAIRHNTNDLYPKDWIKI
jgi:hypothetical protein